jgi:hypothetical protein
MSNQAAIDPLNERLQAEYTEYDRIMQSMPKYMDWMEHKRWIAKANHQRGVLDGLKKAIEMMESEQ